MKRGWIVIFIWLAFACINLAIYGVIDLSVGIGVNRIPIMRQGLWISIAVNALYLVIFAHPWTGRIPWVLRVAPFLSLFHLVLNLFGILVYYQMGGLQNRHTGMGFAAIVLVHLVFVKWALLSILRPHLEQVK